MGRPEDGAAFFAEYWPEAQGLCDGPDLTIHKAFGLRRGTVSQMANVGVIACAVRAVAKGNIPGVPVGDPLQMPGWFYVKGDRVLWQRDYAHSGDSPNWVTLPECLPVPAA